ncbi:MAG: hypothetical protein HC915_14330 [Anaerolineae bacterium]|nr:hypothetical protein [Anaerolineae bacterium]
MLADLSAEPGALPLLQYCLTEVFERRQDRLLTLGAYQAIGGVQGALARRAEERFLAMDEGHQASARQLFLRLVTPGEGAEDTRRRLRWSEMLAIAPDRAVMQAVLDDFGRYRLLTFDHDPETREPTIEVAHEAVLRGWQRLRGWLEDSREELRLQRRLAAAAEEWQKQAKDPSFLASGARLIQFEQLEKGNTVALTEAERVFILASVAQRQAQQATEEARLARERALEQRSRQVLRALVAVFFIAAVVALGLALAAVQQQQAAEEARDDARENAATAVAERDRADNEARVARSRELSVRAINALDEGSLDTALLLAIAGYQVDDNFATRSALLTALQSEPALVTILHAPPGQARATAIQPDGSQAAAAVDRSVQRWDLATNQPLGAPLAGHTDVIWALAYHPTGQWLASGAEDGTIRLWDAASGAETTVIDAAADTVYALHFLPGWGTAFRRRSRKFARLVRARRRIAG